MSKLAKRLAANVPVDTVNHIIYTCPSNVKAYLTHIHCANASTTTAALLTIYIDTTDGTYTITSGQSLAFSSYEDFESSPGYILNAGDTLNVASSALTTTIVNGYEELIT